MLFSWCFIKILLSQSTLSKHAFQIFTCKQLGDAGFFLLEDLTVPCYDTNHIFAMLTLGATCLLLYAFGIPLTALYLLRKYF